MVSEAIPSRKGDFMFPRAVFRSMPGMSRPFGVTLLAFLTLFGGLLYLALALGFFGLALMADQGTDEVYLLMALFILIISVAFFIATRGLLRGSGWAWTLAVIVTALSFIGNLLSAYAYGFDDQVTWFSTIFGLLLSMLIFVYLFTSGVRRFFGRL